MITLYFLRHATAADIATSDAARALTSDGKEEARIAGAALATLDVKPSRVLSSPLVRALQTARLAAKACGCEAEIKEIAELENGPSTAALLKVLKSFSDAKGLLLVGHMPSIAEHIATLIGAENTDAVAMGKGAMACVEMDQLKAGTGQLRWLMRQKQLREIAR